MTSYLLQFAADDTGSGFLGLDGKALLIQLITFVLAFLVLRRFAFEPILKVLKERRELIESGVALGEQMKQDKAKLDAKVDAELHKARKQADGIISAAQESGQTVVREAEAKAQEKAAGILREADERIKTDTQRARKQLEKELVGLISDATEAIIGEKVDDKKDAQLIDKALQEQRA